MDRGKVEEHGMRRRTGLSPSIGGTSCLVVLISMLACMVGCGGGGGGGVVTDPTVPPAPLSLSGTVIDAPVAEGLVKVFALDADGARGQQIAAGMTDGNGRFSFEAGQYSGDVLLEVVSGTFPNLVDGTQVYELNEAAGRTLTTIIPGVASGQSYQSIAITPLTHLVSQVSLRALSETEGSLSQCLADTSNAMATELGLTQYGVDLLNTLPYDATATPPSGCTEAQTALSLWMAGLNQAATSPSAVASNPVDWLNAYLADAADGSIDEVTLLQELADGCDTFCASPDNETGSSFDSTGIDTTGGPLQYDAAAYYDAGLDAIHAKNLSLAQSMFESALGQDSEHAKARLLVAFMALGTWVEANTSTDGTIDTLRELFASLNLNVPNWNVFDLSQISEASTYPSGNLQIGTDAPPLTTILAIVLKNPTQGNSLMDGINRAILELEILVDGDASNGEIDGPVDANDIAAIHPTDALFALGHNLWVDPGDVKFTLASLYGLKAAILYVTSLDLEQDSTKSTYEIHHALVELGLDLPMSDFYDRTRSTEGILAPKAGNGQGSAMQAALDKAAQRMLAARTYVVDTRGDDRATRMHLFEYDEDLALPSTWADTREMLNRCLVSPEAGVLPTGDTWTIHNEEHLTSGDTVLCPSKFFSANGGSFVNLRRYMPDWDAEDMPIANTCGGAQPTGTDNPITFDGVIVSGYTQSDFMLGPVTFTATAPQNPMVLDWSDGSSTFPITFQVRSTVFPNVTDIGFYGLQGSWWGGDSSCSVYSHGGSTVNNTFTLTAQYSRWGSTPPAAPFDTSLPIHVSVEGGQRDYNADTSVSLRIVP